MPVKCIGLRTSTYYVHHTTDQDILKPQQVDATLGCRCLIVEKNLSGKRSIIRKKMHLQLSPLIVWIALVMVNTHAKFQANIFNNKMSVKQSCPHLSFCDELCQLYDVIYSWQSSSQNERLWSCPPTTTLIEEVAQFIC